MHPSDAAITEHPLFPEHQRVFQAISPCLLAMEPEDSVGKEVGIGLVGIEAAAWHGHWKVLATSMEVMGISHAVLPAKRCDSGDAWWVLLMVGVTYASHRHHFDNLTLPKGWFSFASWEEPETAETLFRVTGLAFREE